MLQQLNLRRRYVRCALLVIALAALIQPLRGAPPAHASAPAAPALATASDPGLVGYWPFELGSTDADLSGSGNTVTFGNSMGLTSPAAPTPFANQTALLSSLSPTSYANAPGNNIDNLQQFTIAFWMRVRAFPPDGTGMNLVSLPNKVSVDYSPILIGNHDFAFSVQGANTSSRGLFFHDIQPNIYYHVAAAYDGNGMRVYVNGQLKNSFPGFISLAQGTGVAFSSPTAPFDGNLDDVRIYNRGLSQGEIALMSYNCATVGEIPQAECQALVDLYASAGGPQWTTQTNWLLNNTPCSWYGVLCNQGHVLALSLSNNNLHGPLPPTLSNLSSAIVLSLYNNQLSGTVPPQLGNLSNLVTLDLFNNQLGGTIPAELGGLSKLQTLRLYSNQLRGTIPAQLANLTSLTTLDVGYNALYTNDSALAQFLNAQQPSWANTQTVAPGQLHAAVQSPTSVALIWATIPYTADGGFYEVLASPGTGQYTSVGKTADKTAAGITITGLQAGSSYTFQVRTFTPKHSGQQNDLTSDTSAAVTASPTVATITIALDVQPDSKTNFSFAGGLGAFALDDITPSDGDAYGSRKTFSVPAGAYTVSEQLPSGWYNANISCSPPAGTVADLANNQIVINAAAGANITCTFVTQRAGQLVVGSYNDHNHNHLRGSGDEWLAGWQIQTHSAQTQQVASKTTGPDGRATFTNVRPGAYTICESVQAGWYNITPGGLDPAFGQPCYTITVAPGQAVWARFGNSSTPLASAASLAPSATALFSDVMVCDLAATDDAGNPITPERDLWEEQETAATHTIFLALVRR